jgi:hypothetical protein
LIKPVRKKKQMSHHWGVSNVDYQGRYRLLLLTNAYSKRICVIILFHPGTCSAEHDVRLQNILEKVQFVFYIIIRH